MDPQNAFKIILTLEELFNEGKVSIAASHF